MRCSYFFSLFFESCRMAMLAMLVTDPAIDMQRLVRICLVHDLAESLVGDITPYDKKTDKKEKARLEEEAMRKIAGSGSQ